MILPWHQENWRIIQNAYKKQRLSHALLLAGSSGIGKSLFADYWSRSLLCHQITQEGYCCNDCHACRLTEGRTHPNVLWIQPEKEGHAIKVDQIREVNDFINQSSFNGVYRIVIMQPADSMNVNAANALLKTLEEPASGALIILLSDQTGRLPATILSRCQKLNFKIPDKNQALAWLKSQLDDKTINANLLLKLAHGAPLTALSMYENHLLKVRATLFEILFLLSQRQGDPIKLAAKLQEYDLSTILEMCLTLVIDLLRLKMQNELILNDDYQTKLVELESRLTLETNMKLMDSFKELRMQSSYAVSLNKQLFLENMLIQWMNLTNKVNYVSC